MTTKHIQQARIQRLSRNHVRVEEVEEYDNPMLYAPVALAFTREEVIALARHLSSDMNRIAAGSDLLAARDAIFAAALDALSADK